MTREGGREQGVHNSSSRQDYLLLNSILWILYSGLKLLNYLVLPLCHNLSFIVKKIFVPRLFFLRILS